jgi:predicted SAM-dependent methyltransferase
MYLNLGCGFNTPKQWINVDYALGARIAKRPLLLYLSKKLNLVAGDWSRDILIHDLSTELPFESDSSQCVYLSHTLEHFDISSGRTLLRECFRVLSPGGSLRVVVPDLDYFLLAYQSQQVTAIDLLPQLMGNVQSNARGLRRIAECFFSFPHKVSFNREELRKELASAGFKEIEDCDPLVSRNPKFLELESIESTKKSIVIEATK